MKIIKKSICIMLVLMMLLTLLSACGMSEEEKQCVLDIQSGLQSRWDFTNKEYTTCVEYQDNIAKGIDAELGKIGKYKDFDFESDEFDTIIKKYITALENQKEGIGFKFYDISKYNELYIYNGLEVRKECLKLLESKYGLSVDDNYKENFDNVLGGEYTPLVAPNTQVKFDTEYGEIGIKFLGFETLLNPSEEKELVIYCEIENFSYYDSWNGESLIFDYFMGVYDEENYNIEFKSSAHDYIDGYKECMGFADLKQGEKGKFAILLEYSTDIDIIYISFGGEDNTYGCYLTSANYRSAHNFLGKTENPNVDYSIVREQMSNFSCEGMYNIYDGWLYSLNFPEGGGNGLFAKMRTDGDEYSILTEKGTPYYIYIDSEYIYFIIGSGKTTNIYRCRLGGNDLTQLVKDNAWYLQVTDNYLYYNKYDPSTGITSGFYKSNKDGSNETLIIDKEIYYSYVVGNTLYYQDDNDNETVHKYNLNTKSDEKITNDKSYGFVIDGDNGYYIKNDNSSTDGDWIGTLVKINLKTKEEEVLYDGVATQGVVVGQNEIYFINANDQSRIYSVGKDGKGVKLITQDTNCYNLAIFGKKIMYADYTDDKKHIEAIYLCEADGSNKIKISQNE